MGFIKTKSDILLSVYCPYLNRSVNLKKDTWYHKIIEAHPEVSNCIKLIEQILSTNDKSILKYRRKKHPNEIAIFKEVPHLLPLNRYIKIGLKLLNDKEAIVTTVHGKYNLVNLDMEVI